MVFESHPTPAPAPERIYSPPRGRPVPGFPGVLVRWARSLTAAHGLAVHITAPGRPDETADLATLNADADAGGRFAAAVLRAVEGGT